MLKKTVTYIDFDGNERTEDFYFNLTKAEIAEMEFSTQGGLTRFLNKIVAEQNHKRIVEAFKDLVIRSYGEKSPDGRRFIKTQEVKDNFSQTEAYSQIFMELAMDAEAAAAFVNGIVPQVDKPVLKPV
jgi:hypothetical protein